MAVVLESTILASVRRSLRMVSVYNTQWHECTVISALSWTFVCKTMLLCETILLLLHVAAILHVVYTQDGIASDDTHVQYVRKVTTIKLEKLLQTPRIIKYWAEMVNGISSASANMLHKYVVWTYRHCSASDWNGTTLHPTAHTL